MNHAMNYKPAYADWPIVTIHGHYGYIGQDRVKKYGQIVSLGHDLIKEIWEIMERWLHSHFQVTLKG